jgi:hypothetical protein
MLHIEWDLWTSDQTRNRNRTPNHHGVLGRRPESRQSREDRVRRGSGERHQFVQFAHLKFAPVEDIADPDDAEQCIAFEFLCQYRERKVIARGSERMG